MLAACSFPEGRAPGAATALDGVIAQEGVLTVEEFKTWTRRRIRAVLPHEMFVSGYGHLHAGGVSLDYAVTVDYPASYMHCIRNRAGGLDSPILRGFLATREPQLFEADHPSPDVPAAWLECFRKHGMHNLAAHGQFDAERCVATYHSFYRMPGRLGQEHVDALRSVVPVMHEALCRVAQRLQAEGDVAARLGSLTPCEKEMVQLVCQGRTNGEIAVLSHLSQNTVKHHLTSIFAKLGVQSRAQLMCLLAAQETKAAMGGSIRIL